MKKIIAPIMSVIALLGFGVALMLSPNSHSFNVQAATEPTTQNLGQNDSVTVPLANLIINNFEHEYPPPYVCTQPGCLVVHYTGATLLRFVFDNGTERVEIFYSVTERWKPINYKYWEYDFWTDGDYWDLLNFTDTSNGLVITQNLDNQYKDLFSEVSIYTYQSSCTIQAGAFTPTEFTVVFMTVDGEILTTLETVGRYIPSELIPNAPQIDKRPFLRWTNVQGFAVDEIITSNVTFLPLYSYDPNFKVEDPKDTEPTTENESIIDEIKNFFNNNKVPAFSLIGVVGLIFLILIIKGATK